MSEDLPSEIFVGKQPRSPFEYCNENLNFAAASRDEEDYGYRKKKMMRDPMSHRIIEKRRRDRMNNCLADLSRLIPPEYLKKGRGRIEKTEIIEMAIKHMRQLQSVIASSGSERDDCSGDRRSANSDTPQENPCHQPIIVEHYKLGYLECLSEAMHFLVEVQGYFAGDSLCVQMINHLHEHCDKIVNSGSLNYPRKQVENLTGSCSSPTEGNYSNRSPPLGLSASNGSSSDDNQPAALFENGIDDAFGNTYEEFRSPRRYSDLSSGTRSSAPPKNTGDYRYRPRCSEPESERVSENPSDSDLEQGSVRRARNSSERFEDPGKCGSGEYQTASCSSSSGIGSNPECLPFDDEENGSSQLRDALTYPKTSGHSPNSSRCRDPERVATPFHISLLDSRLELSCRPVERFAPSESAAPPGIAVEGKPSEVDCNHAEGITDSERNQPPDPQGYMYKFKNNIKQRFSKERRIRESDEGQNLRKRPKIEKCDLDGSCSGQLKLVQSHVLTKEKLDLLEERHRRIADSKMKIRQELEDGFEREMMATPVVNEDVENFVLLRRFPERERKQFPSSGLECFFPTYPRASSAPLQADNSVAVFALHAGGAFYVPLALDPNLLAPYASLLGFSKTEHTERNIVLHPISISVNFQASCQVRQGRKNWNSWK